MSNPVIYWVIGGLLVLFFFFLIWKFTQTWRVWHILAMFFMFAAALAMCGFAALSLRTHNTWRTQFTKLSRELEKEEQARTELLHGPIGEVIQSKPSIRSAIGDERRELIDRGRVWRGCIPLQAMPDDTVVVNTSAAPAVPPGVEPAAEPAAPGEGAAPANGGAAPAAPAATVDENMIVHVFVEDLAPPEENLPAGTKVPRMYIGEFVAAAVAGTNVTLKPTSPLDNFEKSWLRRGNATWVLYETMPVDQHRIFAADPRGTPDLNQNADESPVFGAMDEAKLKRLFIEPTPEQAPSPEVFKQFQDRYLRMVTPYQRDGRRASDEDPPENVWLKVRFTQPHKEEVDTAGDPVGAVVSSQMFFDRGRAEIAVLQRGKAVEFKQGDVGVFPQADANRLIATENVCELIEPVYVRKLNDYEYGFDNIRLQLAQLDKARRQLLRDTSEVTRANELALEQIALCQQARQKVAEDLEKTRLERDRITQYVAQLEGESTKLRDEMRMLYRVNFELANQLAQLDQQMTERIDRAAQAAVGPAP